MINLFRESFFDSNSNITWCVRWLTLARNKLHFNSWLKLKNWFNSNSTEERRAPTITKITTDSLYLKCEHEAVAIRNNWGAISFCVHVLLLWSCTLFYCNESKQITCICRYICIHINIYIRALPLTIKRGKHTIRRRNNNV